MDRFAQLNDDERVDLLQKSFTQAPWKERTKQKPNTEYALAAMSEVGDSYTRISLETADRVKQKLERGLVAAGQPAMFRIQGSVPLNIHIRAVSDVDLLTLDDGFVTIDTSGRNSTSSRYTSTSRKSVGVLSSLRASSETILRASYPKATVDTSGGKAIKIFGGSLPRPVDVVPSHWYDTAAYQTSGLEHERAVTILDKKIPETLNNWPFLHIKKIKDQADIMLGDGLRKAIRLCKNVKADAEAEGTKITLPSFDIAATMYHANMAILGIAWMFELAVLSEAQRHLDELATDHDKARKLLTPDGSRKIFNTDAKLKGLNALSIEMDDLLREVAKEQSIPISRTSKPDLYDCRMAINGIAVP